MSGYGYCAWEVNESLCSLSSVCYGRIKQLRLHFGDAVSGDSSACSKCTLKKETEKVYYFCVLNSGSINNSISRTSSSKSSAVVVRHKHCWFRNLWFEY